MILCFSLFATILNWCKQGLPQERFVPRVVWVVDRKNRCLMSNLDIELDADALDTMVAEGNGPLVRKLLVCQQKLKLRSKLPSVENASKSFKSKVMPYLNEDKISKAVLAVLYIIDKDKTIATERKESFKKYIGMDKEELLQQKKFDVPDLFARVLLYTTCVDNKEGKSYAIDKKHLEDFIKDVINNSWAELKWDAVTQTVELIPTGQLHLWDEVERISNLRLSLWDTMLEDSGYYTDTGWLGIDKHILFPNIREQRHVKFKDPETQRLMFDKMDQYSKLVHELVECLLLKHKSVSGQAVEWPVFPSERMRNIRQQLTALSDELRWLGMTPD